MSHKGKNSAGKGKKPKGGGETKSEDVLQAVVLADSFQDRFRPFTAEKPRCLLPLANTPLIEYTFEFLAMNGVNEVYIYCGSHTEQVEEYVNGSRWATTSTTSPFSVVQFVRVSDARSVGDVLRDMDKRSLVDGDFVLVHGDLVSNVRLDGVLAAHRKRREESAANIMTMVLTSSGSSSSSVVAAEHRTRAKGITPVFAIDSRTKRCLHYDEVNALASERYVVVDPAVTDELSSDFEIRADLVDAQIDICTPEVLALWSESFDYELPRRNFLHGVLKDWELNGKMIYADVLPHGYAARASNLQMYDAISRDVLDGWTAPLSPLANLLPSQSYAPSSPAVAMERGVDFSRGAVLARSVVGRGSHIAKGARVANSVVGRGCRIGAGAVVEDSFLWGDVTVGEGAKVSRSIVADKAVVGAKAVLEPGCLVSFGANVAEGTTLAAGSTVSNLALPADEDDASDADDEDPSRLQKSLIYSLPEATVSSSSVSTLSSAISDSDSDDDAAAGDDDLLGPGASHRSRLSSFTSDDSGDGGVRAAFHHDAVTGLLDALRAPTGDFSGAKLEFMGLRLANDASDAMMRRAIAAAFSRRAIELLSPDNGGLEPAKAAERAFAARPGAAHFVSEVGVGQAATDADQVEFVLALQRALRQADLEAGRAGTLLAAMLQQLYALDIVEEDGILAWWADKRAAEAEMDALRVKCRVLVEWLENAEEEDDSDDDDSD